MKINLKEIANEINANTFAPESKWQFETIEYIDTKETLYGKLDRYEVTVRFKASKYDDNGYHYQVNHYVDDDAYVIYYQGSCFLA